MLYKHGCVSEYVESIKKIFAITTGSAAQGGATPSAGCKFISDCNGVLLKTSDGKYLSVKI